ncbi:hypothetical protein BOW16_12990, partial [Solemya velum gill symbiont]
VVNESCFMDMSVDCCLTLIMSILCFDGNKSEFPKVIKLGLHNIGLLVMLCRPFHFNNAALAGLVYIIWYINTKGVKTLSK